MAERINKRRQEMGEEAWAKYQQQRKLNKAKTWSAKNVEKVVDWRRRTKEKLIEYKGGKCMICGYNKDCPSAYDFHHRDPKEKSFGISSKNIKKFEDLIKEVDKCDLLCCRCHHELHEVEYAQQRKDTKKRHQDWLDKIDQSWLIRREIDLNCKSCNLKFKPKAKLQVYCCDKCAKIGSRKVVRPSLEQLKEDLRNLSYVAVGKKYGVSDSAVRKWLNA